MKLKKFLLLTLIGFLFITAFTTSNLIAPEEADAWITTVPTPVEICCMAYAKTCPDQVRNLCYWDCMEFSCGW